MKSYTCRIIVNIFLVLSLFTISGCATVAVKSMQEAPVHNWIYLHPNYKVGDYAIFESIDHAQKMKFEIASIEDGLIEVKISWLQAQTIVDFLRNLSYHLFADENGHIQKAFLYDKQSGVRRSLKIAEPGDYNYIDDPKSVLLKRKEIITTKAGTFEIGNVIVFNQHISNFALTAKVTSVYFIHPGVKFGLVRERDVMESYLQLAELIEYIVKLSPLSTVQKSIMNYIINNAKDTKHYWGLDLIETN
jgi:hypothetical protein